MKWEHVASDDCFQGITQLIIGILELPEFNKSLQEYFERHIWVVFVNLTKDQVHSLLIHQVLFMFYLSRNAFLVLIRVISQALKLLMAR